MRTLLACLILALSTPAFAAPNDLVRDPSGDYVLEINPRSGGWLATVMIGPEPWQVSLSFQTEELYDLFQAFKKAGVQRLRCREANGFASRATSSRICFR